MAVIDMGYNAMKANNAATQNLNQGVQALYAPRQEAANQAAQEQLLTAYLSGGEEGLRNQLLSMQGAREDTFSGGMGLLNRLNPMASQSPQMTPIEQALGQGFLQQGMVDPQQRQLNTANINRLNATTEGVTQENQFGRETQNLRKERLGLENEALSTRNAATRAGTSIAQSAEERAVQRFQQEQGRQPTQDELLELQRDLAKAKVAEQQIRNSTSMLGKELAEMKADIQRKFGERSAELGIKSQEQGLEAGKQGLEQGKQNIEQSKENIKQTRERTKSLVKEMELLDAKIDNLSKVDPAIAEEIRQNQTQNLLKLIDLTTKTMKVEGDGVSAVDKQIFDPGTSRALLELAAKQLSGGQPQGDIKSRIDAQLKRLE